MLTQGTEGYKDKTGKGRVYRPWQKVSGAHMRADDWQLHTGPAIPVAKLLTALLYQWEVAF